MTKLIFTLCMAVIIYGGPGRWLSAFLPGLFALSFLWRAGLAGKAFTRIFYLLGPLAAVLCLTHGFLYSQNKIILFQIGSFSLGWEGILFAALIIVRLMSVLSASLVLVLTTQPDQLVQALEETGLHHGFAYLMNSPLLLIPQIAGRAQAIQSAQQARGMETRGSLLQRAKALFPMVGPLVFSSLVDVEERSLALEVRGFNSPNQKTHLNELMDNPNQKLARRVMLLATVLFLIAGIWWRLYGGH